MQRSYKLHLSVRGELFNHTHDHSNVKLSHSCFRVVTSGRVVMLIKCWSTPHPIERLPSNILDSGATADMQMFLQLSTRSIEAQKNYHGGILYMNAQTQHLDGLINEAVCNVQMALFLPQK